MNTLWSYKYINTSLPHFVSIKETENSIPFISSPSPIQGSILDHISPLQLHLDGEAIEDTKDSNANIESRIPKVNTQQCGLPNTMDLESSEEGKISSKWKSVGGKLSGDIEATISRDTFEGMLETLSSMKESIGRALAEHCVMLLAMQNVALLVR